LKHSCRFAQRKRKDPTVHPAKDSRAKGATFAAALEVMCETPAYLEKDAT
jgi:hypothetical protein